MQRMCLLWGKRSWGKHVGDGGAHCPLLVVPIRFFQGLCLFLELQDPSFGFSHQLHVSVWRVTPSWFVSSEGNCFTNLIITHPGFQQSSVHIDVRGNQLVRTELQHRVINKRGFGVTQYFIFKGCNDHMDHTKGKEERERNGEKGELSDIQ